MRTIRVVGLVAAIAALGTAAMVVHQASAQQVAPSTVSAATAASDLATIVTKTKSVDFKIAVKAGDESFTGAFSTEARASNVLYVTTEGGKSTFVTTADTTYVIGDAAARTDKYVALAVSRMAARCAFAAAADPFVGLSLAAAAVSVEQTNSTTYTGKLDIGKVTGDRNTMATTAYLASYMSGQTTAEFTATVSGSYLTSFQATFIKARPDGTDLTYVMTLSAHGEANKVTVPSSGNVVAAPDDMYLNG